MSGNGMPGRAEIARVLVLAQRALATCGARLRPLNAVGRPGGLVYLPPSRYLVIVPDLHGRAEFLRTVMRARLPVGSGSVEDDLARGHACVVCVGDAFHAEARARERWRRAYREYVNGYSHSPAMDEEMAESFETLCEVASLQSAYPHRFHFLKGNHENIANERREGNFPFRKFAYEGEMVREWVLQRLGAELFRLVYKWEKALPLAAAGDRVLVTHAEPPVALTPRRIVDAYLDPDVIAGLTWTANGDAEDGSVAGTLGAFFPGRPCARLFGGHRPVPDRYALRQDGRYVQVNTPHRQVVAAFSDVEQFDPERDIVDLTQAARTHHDSDT
mgnify:CR=1 FL=1